LWSGSRVGNTISKYEYDGIGQIMDSKVKKECPEKTKWHGVLTDLCFWVVVEVTPAVSFLISELMCLFDLTPKTSSSEEGSEDGSQDNDTMVEYNSSTDQIKKKKEATKKQLTKRAHVPQKKKGDKKVSE